MNKKTEQLLKSLQRAMKAEIKQGYIDTGALGGFSDFLANILPALRHCYTPETYSKLKNIAAEYSNLSPYKRKIAFKELVSLLDEILSSQGNYSTADRPNSEISPKSHSPESQMGQDNKDERKQKENNKQKEKTAADNKNSLQYIKGVGPQRVIQLQKLGINNLTDLLMYYPRKYELRVHKRIEDLKDGETAVVSGKVIGSQISRGRVKVVKLNIEQAGRNIYAVWFNQVHIAKNFPAGTEVSVTGKVQWQRRVPEILASDIQKGRSQGDSEKMLPIYSETAKLNSKAIRTIIKNVLPLTEEIFAEVLEEEDRENRMMRAEAYQQIHFPSSHDNLKRARERIVFEEILFLQLALSRLRTPSKQNQSPILKGGGDLVQSFIKKLPFALTSAQKRVLNEIFRDMEKDKGMTRLLQGDVGSGKTVVAMAALLKAVGAGFQGAMMAPTEVLAGQHFESLQKNLGTLGIKIVILTGSQSKKEREEINHLIYSGKAQVIVGTHALIQEEVRFHSLGLVVTDEQHRFGVRQRSLLEDKGENPHVLVMTATPIPRTLALTAYGDLQLSVIDEMPAGRRRIITKKISERSRPNLENFLEQQISSGRQIYVVCPLVEETEKTDLVSATDTAARLQERFPDRKIALLHGRMKGQEKEDIMRTFREGRIDILVATTVVEVGVNVPNATVMVVEDAQRFGLAQLHQLRGRVGRGSEQSYCILMSDTKESARLEILCKTENGFRIAEEDLKLRGPGELVGIRQHGVPELRLTDLIKDSRIVEEAYQLLQRIIASPERYQEIYQAVEQIYPLEKIGVN